MQCGKCKMMVPVGAEFCVRCKSPVSPPPMKNPRGHTQPTLPLSRGGNQGIEGKFASPVHGAHKVTPYQRSEPTVKSGSLSTSATFPRKNPSLPKSTGGQSVPQGPLKDLLQREPILDQKFKLEREIGRGGMGFVYLATDLSLNRQVAVKILPPHYNDDKAVVGRFQREARAMASLDHPNIVTVYSIGYDVELHYFVMKHLEGETLAHTIKRVELGHRPPVSALEMIDLMIQACNGLEHAHNKSLLHRDIKPGNLMLSSQGKLTIMDFGIVKRLDDSESVGLKTAHGKIFGTPEYMPPEQAMGKGDYSPASDLYALAVVGYELLCGELPYVAETPIGIIIQHIRADIPKLKGRAKDQYPIFEAVFMRALAKEPAQRYTSASQLRSTLQGVKQSLSSPTMAPIDSTAPLSDETIESFSELNSIELNDEDFFLDDMDMGPQVTYPPKNNLSQLSTSLDLESEPVPPPPPTPAPLSPSTAQSLTPSPLESPRVSPPPLPTSPVSEASVNVEQRPTASLRPASSRPGHYKGLPFKRK